MFQTSPDCFVISETKLYSSSPSVQFHISNYEVRERRDWNKNKSGIINMVKIEFICKTLENLEGWTLNLLILSKSVFVSVW